MKARMSFSYDILKKNIFLCFFISAATSGSTTRVFNVMDYGAVPDGKTDSTKAIQTAWNEACAFEGTPGVIIPEGSFFVGPLKFKGPCKSPMVFQLKGAMIATSDLSRFDTTEWIAFHYINGLLITGGGKLDGQGALAWPHNKCNKNQKCKRLPTAINFSFVTNATVEDIASVDSKNFHLQLFKCDTMKFHSLRITAPYDSPNTDGIHLADSKNIVISSAIIGTGDDCISIGPGTENVSISNIYCGPGHGISVGNLGHTAGEGDVVGLSVTNCTLADTTNGIRIKTWQDSPTASSAYNFTFDDVVMRNVDNPIIIDQKYCPHNVCSRKAPSKVKINNINFINIRGDSKSRVAINLVCSDFVPCQGIVLQDINLNYAGQGTEAASSCTNVKGIAAGFVTPASCL